MLWINQSTLNANMTTWRGFMRIYLSHMSYTYSSELSEYQPQLICFYCTMTRFSNDWILKKQYEMRINFCWFMQVKFSSPGEKKWQSAHTVYFCSTTRMHPAFIPPTRQECGRQWKRKPDLTVQNQTVLSSESKSFLLHWADEGYLWLNILSTELCWLQLLCQCKSLIPFFHWSKNAG